MPGLDPVSIGLAALPELFQIVSGISGAHKANKAIKANQFPVEQANPLFAQNLAIADNAAKVGLPQQQYSNAEQGFQRNANRGIRALSRLGRPGNIAGIVRAGNDSQLGLDSADAQARMANQRQAMGARTQLAGEQNRVWDWNSRQKYLQQAQANAQQLGAAKQNIFGGTQNLSQLGQYAMMGYNGNNGYDPSLVNIPNVANNPLNLQNQFHPSMPNGWNPNQWNPNGSNSIYPTF